MLYERDCGEPGGPIVCEGLKEHDFPGVCDGDSNDVRVIFR